MRLLPRRGDRKPVTRVRSCRARSGRLRLLRGPASCRSSRQVRQSERRRVPQGRDRPGERARSPTRRDRTLHFRQGLLRGHASQPRSTDRSVLTRCRLPGQPARLRAQPVASPDRQGLRLHRRIRLHRLLRLVLLREVLEEVLRRSASRIAGRRHRRRRRRLLPGAVERVDADPVPGKPRLHEKGLQWTLGVSTRTRPRAAPRGR